MPELCQDIVTALVLAFTTYASTNLDNLLLMAALSAGLQDRRHAITGFVAATLLILIVSAMFVAFSYVVPPDRIRYLGIIPILLGGKAMITRQTGMPSRPDAAARSPQAVAALLLANSADTVAGFGPLVAESEAVVVAALLAGFAAAAAVWLILIRMLSRHATVDRSRMAKLQRLTPFIMIGVGLYILADTETDIQ
jgi:cadmium resistance protein CadD (predicted permease)